MKQISWNLRLLFNGDDDPSMEKKRAIVRKNSYAFIRKWQDRNDYLTKPAILKQALDEYERWKRYYGPDGDEGYYFWLRTAQDQNSPALKAKFNKIDHFGKKIENDIRFFPLRIARIPVGRQRAFLEYPGLRTYRHHLERIFEEARYLLSEPEEKILNLKSATSYSNWVKMTSSFLSKEERTVLSEDRKKTLKPFSEIMSLMNSSDKRVRDTAAKAFNGILHSYADVAESEINSVLANKEVDDELRGIPRPDIARHVSDDIDTEVVDTLVKAVEDRFEIPRKYYALKARLMKVKRLKYHERNVEFGRITKTYSYPDSIRLVKRTLKGLDQKFLDILDSFTKNGQIDVYPRKGKAGGAFCSHHLITQPTYILLNHTGRLSDVLTLAHELGHGINNEMVGEKHHALDFGTPTSTAEVASTFMEDFVLEEILKEADDELRLSIMLRKLNDDVSTIFRQIACYRFEMDLHKEFRRRGYLSRKEIGALFRKNMAAYMGKAVEQSPGSENWWIYWSHIRSFFYVYSYAGGLLISKSLQQSVKRDSRHIGRVKEFLSAGLSDSPKNIFRRMGVDITDRNFWHGGLDEIDGLLLETASLAGRLGKLH
ncbi:MAG: M3 family oligoendopeptidase [Nitrospirota bacterium]